MNKRIILIDDDHGPMDYFVEALRCRGFDAKQIDSTDDVYMWLEVGDTRTPDLVVVDLMMAPGTRLTIDNTDGGLQSGVHIARAVRERFPDVPIMILTNRPNEEMAGRLPQGTHIQAKYEISPFSFADLVQQLLARSRG
jgi:DNA-binding response OmpR family regulator